LRKINVDWNIPSYGYTAAIKFRVKPFSKGLREFEGRAIKVLLGCGTEFRDFRGEVEEQYPDRDVE